MSTSNIDHAKVKLQEINEIISKLDPAMKESAISVLMPMYFSGTNESQKAAGNGQKAIPAKTEQISASENLEEFIGALGVDKPSDNLFALMAWHYSQYGVEPITTKEINALGKETGLVIPARPDMTIKGAKNDGKALFSQQGKGWRITVSGEMYFKEKYGVKKGKKTLPAEQ